MNEMMESDEGLKSPDKANNQTRNLVIGGVGGLLVLCACLVVASGGLVLLDPFNWNLLDLIGGIRDEAAGAIPADATIYVSADLLRLTPAEINRVTKPFLDLAGDPAVQDFDSALDQFDAELLDEIGLTVQDDILPWIGGHAGFGLTRLALDSFGDVESLDWVLVASTRDKEASDQFLLKFKDGLAESTGYSFVESTYEGVTFFDNGSDDPMDQLAFGRDGSLVIFGSGVDAVQSAIDARSGDSLAEQQAYRSLTSELSRERALTFFVNGSQLDGLRQAMEGDLPLDIDPDQLPLIGSSSAAIALALIDEGIQLDVATLIEEDRLSENQRVMLDASRAKPETDQLFPETTVVYFTGQRLDLVWASIRDAINTFTDPADFEESMDLFSQEFGINPDTELFPYLNGEWAIGLGPSVTGMLADELDLALGVVMVAGSGDPVTLSANMDNLANGLEDQGLEVTRTDEAGITAYLLGLAPGDPPMVVYGLGQSYMFLSSDEGTARRIFAGGPSLADNEAYRQVWQAFPRGVNPIAYVNVGGLIGAISEGLSPDEHTDLDEATKLIGPIPYIAMASGGLSGDVRLISTIVFIEGD